MCLVGGKWIFKTNVPEYRKQTQEIHSSLRGFFQSMKADIVSKRVYSFKKRKSFNWK
jgi:hypothetical protein